MQTSELSYQVKQEIVIRAPLEWVWHFHADITNIETYHPIISQVDLLSGKQFREAGASYRTHLHWTSDTNIETDQEVIPMEKIVTEVVFEQHTSAMPAHYDRITVFSALHGTETKVMMKWHYNATSLQQKLCMLFVKRKLATEGRKTLQAMKAMIELEYAFASATTGGFRNGG